MNVSKSGVAAIIQEQFTRLLPSSKAARAEVFWVVAGQFLALAGGLAGVKLLTTYMGPVHYGQLALGLTIAGLLNLFAYGPISQTALRYYAISQERNELRIFVRILKETHYRVALLSLSVCVAALLSLAIVDFLHEWLLLSAMAIVFGVTTGVKSSLFSVQNAARQRKHVALYQGLDVAVRPLMALGALVILGNSGSSALVGFTVGALIISLSQWRSIAFMFRVQMADVPGEALSRELVSARVREMIGYATPFLHFSVAAAVAMYGDRWMLQGMLGAAGVGIYAAMYQLANAPLSLVSTVAAQFVVPIVFGNDARQGSHVTAAMIVGVLSLVIVFAFYMYGQPILEMLTSTKFSEAHDALWPIALGIAIFNVAQLLVVRGLHLRKPNVYIVPKFIQALALIGGSYVFIGQWGIMGMAAALVGSSVLYLLFVLKANLALEAGS